MGWGRMDRWDRREKSFDGNTPEDIIEDFEVAKVMMNCFQYKKKFKLLGSAHNLLEVNIKKLQKVKEIFISPIFKHKKRSPLGVHKCRYFFNDNSYEKIALGGVNFKNINFCTNCTIRNE